MYFTIKKNFYLAGERHVVYSEGGSLVFNIMFKTQDEAIVAVRALLRAHAVGKRPGQTWDDCMDITILEEDTSKGYVVWTE